MGGEGDVARKVEHSLGNRAVVVFWNELEVDDGVDLQEEVNEALRDLGSDKAEEGGYLQYVDG